MDREQAQEAGFTVYCRHCLELYATIPVAMTETTHGLRPVPCCAECGGDQFANIDDDSEVIDY